MTAARKLQKKAPRLRPHPLLEHIPPLAAHEAELLKARVAAQGQRDPVEVAGGCIVAGQHEYEALLAAGIEPRLTEVEIAGDLVDYIVLRNLPRHLSTLDRGCLAVLIYREPTKAALRAKMTLGRAATEGTARRERWYDHAARMCGVQKTDGSITGRLVKRLASIQDADPAIFEAIRQRRIAVPSDASALIDELRWDYGTNAGERIPNPSWHRRAGEGEKNGTVVRGTVRRCSLSNRKCRPFVHGDFAAEAQKPRWEDPGIFRRPTKGLAKTVTDDLSEAERELAIYDAITGSGT